MENEPFVRCWVNASVTNGGPVLNQCSPGKVLFCLLIIHPLFPCILTALSQLWEMLEDSYALT